jgi:hypothetical protein
MRRSNLDASTLAADNSKIGFIACSSVISYFPE